MTRIGGRTRLLRHSWRKLLSLVLVACVAGTGAGVGLAALSRESKPPSAATTSQRADPSGSRSQTSTTGTAGASLDQLRVRVLGGVLHLAKAPSSQRRQLARVTVRVRADNRTDRVVALARPVLLVGATRVLTDPRADSPRTHLNAVPAGESAAVILRFEVAGSVTETLRAERRARLLIAGSNLPVGVTIGSTFTRTDSPASGDAGNG